MILIKYSNQGRAGPGHIIDEFFLRRAMLPMGSHGRRGRRRVAAQAVTAG